MKNILIQFSLFDSKKSIFLYKKGKSWYTLNNYLFLKTKLLMTEVVTRKDLIALVAEKLGMSKADVERVQNAEKEAILELVQKGSTVKTAFGKFQKVSVKAREGVNPQNPSEKIKIPAKEVLKFHVAPSLKTL